MYILPRKKFSLVRQRTAVSFLVMLAVVLFVASCVPMTEASTTPLSISKESSMLRVNATVSIENYTAIVADPSLKTTTVFYEGTPKKMIELPADSIVVQLPDNRLAIKSPSDEPSLLPNGSSISYVQGKPVVQVPEQSRIIGVSRVVDSPIENFTNKTVFYQSIDQLDTYNVQAIFFELMRDVPEDPLVSYMVDWGDGTAGVYTPQNVTVGHVYEKSGEYSLTINATDSLGFTYVTSQVLTVQYEGAAAHSYLWVKKNKEPVAMASTTGLGLLLLGLVAYTESGRYRLLMLLTLLMPLYTRIQKEDVLDQFVRGQIYGFIKTNPGAHYNQILRQVGVKNGTLSYHLGVLEKTQLIQSRREGLKYRAFYPTGMTFPKKERFRLTELQIQVIEFIRGHPGLTQKEVARALGQKPQTIHYNIKVLGQAGLVDVTRRGRRTRCYPVRDSEPVI